jgi:hypothetical protein
LDEFSPKLALLMETIKKYPNDKHLFIVLSMKDADTVVMVPEESLH